MCVTRNPSEAPEGRRFYGSHFPGKKQARGTYTNNMAGEQTRILTQVSLTESTWFPVILSFLLGIGVHVFGVPDQSLSRDHEASCSQRERATASTVRCGLRPPAVLTWVGKRSRADRTRLKLHGVDAWLALGQNLSRGTGLCGAQHRVSPSRLPGPNWRPEELPANFYGWRVGCDEGRDPEEPVKGVGYRRIWVS